MNLGTHIDGEDDIPGEPSDAQIIEAVRGGDIGDFALLWRRHVESARRAARAISPSSDPDDLVSEAFASILRVTKAGGGPSDAFRPYLLATLRNTAARWARNGTALSIDLVSERDLSAEDGDAFERIAERSSIAAVFGTLSARHRTLLWYLEVEGMKPRELAPLMGMTSNAVSALAARARDSFRRAWLEAHIHDPSRSEECRWFCERVVARRERSMGAGDADRFSEHMNTCGGCRIVAAEIDTVSQRLRSILPAALLGGAAAAIYTGYGTAEAHVMGAASSVGSAGAFGTDGGASFGAGTPAAAHGAASAVPAGGLAALAATAVVVVGAVIFTGSVLTLSARDSDRTALPSSSSEVTIAGEAGPVLKELPHLVVLPPAAEPTPEAQPAPEHEPAPASESMSDSTESDPRESSARVTEEGHPLVPGSDGTPVPSAVAPETTGPTEGSAEASPPVDAPEFRITQPIAQNSLIPDLLEGIGTPGAIITVVDENGVVLHKAIVDEFGAFVLDVSGEETHQGMTLSVRQQNAVTGVTEWAEDIGPLTFATPTIAPADPDTCPGVSLGAVSCLHLRAEPDAWVELLDGQGRSRMVCLPAAARDGIVIRSGADEPFVAARYVDPTTKRAGVTILLPAAIE